MAVIEATPAPITSDLNYCTSYQSEPATGNGTCTLAQAALQCRPALPGDTSNGQQEIA